MFATGPARLSVLTRAPILPAFAVRTSSGRVRVMLENAILPETFGDNTEHMVTAIAAVIGRVVEQFPEQYHGVHEGWVRGERAMDDSDA
jgi:lauroyl/myristoyl acyltransferase